VAVRVDREIFDAVGAGSESGGLRFYEDGTRQAPWQPRPFMSKTEFIVSEAMRLMTVPAEVIRQQVPVTAMTPLFPPEMGYGPQVQLTIQDVLDTDRWSPQLRSWVSGTVRVPSREDFTEDMWSGTVRGFNASPNLAG
jgi:hypothetical protein